MNIYVDDTESSRYDDDADGTWYDAIPGGLSRRNIVKRLVRSGAAEEDKALLMRLQQ